MTLYERLVESYERGYDGINKIKATMDKLKGIDFEHVLAGVAADYGTVQIWMKGGYDHLLYVQRELAKVIGSGFHSTGQWSSRDYLYFSYTDENAAIELTYKCMFDEIPDELLGDCTLKTTVSEPEPITRHRIVCELES